MYSGRRGPGRPRTNPPSYRRSAPVEVLHDLRPLEFLASVFRTPGENDPPSWVRSPDEGYTIDYLLVKATRRGHEYFKVKKTVVAAAAAYGEINLVSYYDCEYATVDALALRLPLLPTGGMGWFTCRG